VNFNQDEIMSALRDNDYDDIRAVNSLESKYKTKATVMEKEAGWTGTAMTAGKNFLGKAGKMASSAFGAMKRNPVATGGIMAAGGVGFGAGALMDKTAASIVGAARTYAGDLRRAASLVGENPHAIKNTAGLMRVSTGQKAAEAVKRSNEMKQMAQIMGSGKLSDKAMADAARNHRIGQRRLSVKQWMDQQSDDRLYSIAKKMN